MAKYTWRYGPNWGYYHSDTEIDRDKVHDAAKALLSKATKGDAWTDPHGTKHIPVMADGTIVGSLWEDATLTDLELATYWAAPFGVKAELSHDGKVVGSVWIDV
jgi:hypothetical protein